MKILFCYTHVYIWFSIDAVARRLCDRGHAVSVLFDEDKNVRWSRRFLVDYKAAPYHVGLLMRRQGLWRKILVVTRELFNYRAYLTIRQPTSPVLVERWRKYLPKWLRSLVRYPMVKWLLCTDIGSWGLRFLEKVAPPARAILQELDQFKPDAVIAAYTILEKAEEVEYVKAARSLGIPTAVAVPSWDNLTTKGTIQIMPDRMFVWNRTQVKEAVDLHGMTAEQVVCTGAPRYDPWFGMRSTASREAFCHQVGLRPEQQFLVYLCSSKFIAGDETTFIREFAEALGRQERLKPDRFALLVRPHPQNLEFWKDFSLPSGNVVVWPTDLNRITDQARVAQDFYHTLLYGIGVVGINTSAFIEAAIVDKPCIALGTERYHYTQLGIPHFQYLLDAGFLEVPRTLDETIQVIQGLVDGKDPRKEQRRQFVKDFVRPCGLETPASQVMADAIEALAVMGRSPRRRRPGPRI
jgi:hypothetical protein